MFYTFAMLSILQMRILFFIFVVNEIFPHFLKRIYWFHFLPLILTCNSDKKKSIFYSRRKNDFFFCSKKRTYNIKITCSKQQSDINNGKLKFVSSDFYIQWDCTVDVLWLRNVQHNQNRLHWTKYVTWIFEAFQSFKWNEHRSNKSTIYFSLEIAIERIVSFF